MSHFWSAFAHQLRDCGRSAIWFFVALGGGFVLLVLGAWALQSGYDNEVIGVVAAGGVAMLYQLAIAIRREVQWRRHRLKFSQLSDDELNKARAKLARHPQPRSCDAPVAEGGRAALVVRIRPRGFSYPRTGDGASPALSATRAAQLRRS